MIHRLLGDRIDIHAGGSDLIFPHHENEIAQSETWTGQTPFVQVWMHNGFVNVSNEKMSKSLGNFKTIKTMLARYDANTIRYFLLTNHYRMPVDFNDDALEGAENWNRRIRETLRRIVQKLSLTLKSEAVQPFKTYQELPTQSVQLRENLIPHSLMQDLNTAQALGLINSLLKLIQSDLASQELTLGLQELFTLFDLLGFDYSDVFDPQEPPLLPESEIQNLYRELSGPGPDQVNQPAEDILKEILDLRTQAKAAKNWSQADAIRKSLNDIGIQVQDNPSGGATWELIPR